MPIDFNKMTKEFLLGENLNGPSLISYIQSLSEALSNMTPRSKTDARRLEIAKEHLKSVKKGVRQLNERINLLEEKLQILEESKED